MTGRDGRFLSTEQSPRMWKPVKLAAALTVDTGMALPVLKDRIGWQIRGETVNSLSPLPPEGHFRKAVLDGAKVFVGRMALARSRYRLKTNESDMWLTGPFQTKGFGRAETANFKTVALNGDEWLWPECLDFRIEGWFVAEFGYLTDMPTDLDKDRDLVQSITVAEWQKVEDAAMRIALANARN